MAVPRPHRARGRKSRQGGLASEPSAPILRRIVPQPPTQDPMTDAGIQITVEGTPNPHAAKFVLDRDIPGEGSRSYFDPESAAGDPLAARLFEVDGVRALLIVENFITVTKTAGLEWPELLDEIEAAILGALSTLR